MTDNDLPDVPALRMLEPPAGGLAALRDRLDAPRARRWWLAGVPALAVAVVIALVVIRRPPVVPAPPAAAPYALADPDVGGGEVAFYWVASTPGGQIARPAARDAPRVGATISIDDVPHVGTLALP